MKLDKAAIRRQRARDWMICADWHFLAERRQGELDAERTARGVRKRRASGIGKVAAAYATALIAHRYRPMTPTRVRQIVHQEQAAAWEREQILKQRHGAVSKAFENAWNVVSERLGPRASRATIAKATRAEQARIMDEFAPDNSIAKRRSKVREKRKYDKLAKRMKRKGTNARERTQRMLEKHPILSVYNTTRRRI